MEVLEGSPVKQRVDGEAPDGGLRMLRRRSGLSDLEGKPITEINGRSPSQQRQRFSQRLAQEKVDVLGQPRLLRQPELERKASLEDPRLRLSPGKSGQEPIEGHQLAQPHQRCGRLQGLLLQAAFECLAEGAAGGVVHRLHPGEERVDHPGETAAALARLGGQAHPISQSPRKCLLRCLSKAVLGQAGEGEIGDRPGDGSHADTFAHGDRAVREGGGVQPKASPAPRAGAWDRDMDLTGHDVGEAVER